MAEVPLQEQDRVLIRALGRRKFFLGAGHEGFAPIQRRELVRFVGGRVVVFRVLPEERQENATGMLGRAGGAGDGRRADTPGKSFAFYFNVGADASPRGKKRKKKKAPNIFITGSSPFLFTLL